MTTFWIGWFVTGQLQKQAQQQSNGKETAKADLPPSHPSEQRPLAGDPGSAKDDRKKQTNKRDSTLS
jgi:hypothetical protein